MTRGTRDLPAVEYRGGGARVLDAGFVHDPMNTVSGRISLIGVPAVRPM